MLNRWLLGDGISDAMVPVAAERRLSWASWMALEKGELSNLNTT